MFNNAYYHCGTFTSLEAELSVAAFHSVVASVGGTMTIKSPKADAWGGDVACTFSGRFTDSPGETITEDICAQLKATCAPNAAVKNGLDCWTLSLEVDKLKRYLNWGSRFFLALFVAPPVEEIERWVKVDAETIVIEKSLFWTFLRGFPVDDSKKSNTLYIPKKNVLTPEALVEVVALARSGKGRYNV